MIIGLTSVFSTCLSLLPCPRSLEDGGRSTEMKRLVGCLLGVPKSSGFQSVGHDPLVSLEIHSFWQHLKHEKEEQVLEDFTCGSDLCYLVKLLLWCVYTGLDGNVFCITGKDLESFGVR